MAIAQGKVFWKKNSDVPTSEDPILYTVTDGDVEYTVTIIPSLSSLNRRFRYMAFNKINCSVECADPSALVVGKQLGILEAPGDHCFCTLGSILITEAPV